MTSITINNLHVDNHDSLDDLSYIELNATRGGILPVIAAAWLGYSIAKEIKLHLN